MIRAFLVTVGDSPFGNVVVAEVEPESARRVAVVNAAEHVAVDGLPSRDIARVAAELLSAALPPDWGGGR